jgi:hypothetical protein
VDRLISAALVEHLEDECGLRDVAGGGGPLHLGGGLVLGADDVLSVVVMTSSSGWLFREKVTLVMRFFLRADAFLLVRGPPSSLRRRIVAV